MNSADQFEAIVGEHYEPLFRFAMSLTRVESDARDLTQQTFYIWATKGHQLRDISKVKTWLFTTLHRSFLAARRREIRFPHLEFEELAEPLPALSSEPGKQTDSSQVLAALAKVDEVYQAAVALFYWKTVLTRTSPRFSMCPSARSNRASPGASRSSGRFCCRTIRV